MAEIHYLGSKSDALRVQVEAIADRVGKAIAVADQRGATEDYLDGAANSLVQSLMAVDYRLERYDAQEIVVQHVLRALARFGIPVRDSWRMAEAGTRPITSLS